MIMFISVLVVVYLYKKRKRTLLSALNLARDELSRIEDDFNLQNDPVKIIRSLSALLRRLCISIYPRSETASLTGKEWLEFLDRPFSSAHFTSEKGRILVEAPYRQQVSNTEVEFLLNYSRDWIKMVSEQKEI